jgi:hypothetical protein
MDVKSAFLNGPINEAVYVEQSPSFESKEYPNYVYKLHKVFYGPKQAPRSWYKCFSDFPINNSFRIDKADSTLFTRRMSKDLFVYQIYIDDIIFSSTNKSSCDEFSKIMTDRFEMSMMGELTFFFEFQIKKVEDETFISQTKYTHDTLKKFSMDNDKPIKTLMGTNDHLYIDMGGTSVDHSIIESLFYFCASMPDIILIMCVCARFQVTSKYCHLRVIKIIMSYLVLTPKLGLWYPKGLHFELIGYSDADYAGYKVNRKSTSGTYQILGQSLVSWLSKKQNFVAQSMTEAEYVTTGSCCAQLLWM